VIASLRLIVPLALKRVLAVGAIVTITVHTQAVHAPEVTYTLPAAVLELLMLDCSLLFSSRCSSAW